VPRERNTILIVCNFFVVEVSFQIFPNYTWPSPERSALLCFPSRHSADRGVLTREECKFRGYRDRNYDVRSLCRQEFAKMIAFITSLPFRQKKVSDLSFRSSCRDCRPLAVLKGIVVRSGIAWSRIRCDATPVSNNFSIFNLFPIGPHP
jgi:hypothetical protein